MRRWMVLAAIAALAGCSGSEASDTTTSVMKTTTTATAAQTKCDREVERPVGLTVLKACETLADYAAAGIEAGAFNDITEAARSAQLQCDMTDVGIRGEGATYSTLCAEAARLLDE